MNHLLVVGFYLINLGYVALALKYGVKPEDGTEAIEFASWKIGFVLVVLGIMHFFNLFVFTKLKRTSDPGGRPDALAPEEPEDRPAYSS